MSAHTSVEALIHSNKVTYTTHSNHVDLPLTVRTYFWVSVFAVFCCTITSLMTNS
jgi:hypothetical protein